MGDANDFKKFLATEILSEQRTVSYRSVSRALKVHVNAAKRMLYEFHEHENKKKPGSVHATYILSGTKKRTQPICVTNGHANGAHNDEDEPMPPSSPPPFTSSMLEASEHGSQVAAEERLEVPVRTIALIREEALEELKEQFDTLTSTHMYSLSPHRIQDLATLTDINRGLYTDFFAKEDPLVHNKTYGVIQNPEVRRRKGKRPIIADAPAPKFKPIKDEPKATSTTSTSKSLFSASSKKQEPSRPGSPGSTTSAATTTSTKQPALKRDASDFFKKSFGNVKSKPKLERNDTDASTNASASGAEDAKMEDADEEGESEDDAMFLDTGTTKTGTKKRASDVKRERDDKAAKLRKMMDSDDDEEPTVPNVEGATAIKVGPVASDPGGAGGEEGEDVEVAWSDSDTEQKKTAPGKDSSTKGIVADDSQDVVMDDEPKRRRGRRKVMKKKTTKDEDGYLVTKEEAVWESFSEDEPEPVKPSAKTGARLPSRSAAQTTKSSGTAKAGKGGAAKGGGSIMSFFGKK